MQVNLAIRRSVTLIVDTFRCSVPMSERPVQSMVAVPSGPVVLAGTLTVPVEARGAVIFSHGSGSGRHSPRNQQVAGVLQQHGLATLLLDLLTVDEDRDYERRFDIALLTGRLLDAIAFIRTQPFTRGLPVGLFGASTGAASALRAAATQPAVIGAVVSRGGRPDLAGESALRKVQAPTLLIVGGKDHGVIELNQAAHEALRCVREVRIVPKATHLFEERGALEEVARLAADWFSRYLCAARPREETFGERRKHGDDTHAQARR
jgi:pimeloyl-ACP methyl ester carboxylesterase